MRFGCAENAEALRRDCHKSFSGQHRGVHKPDADNKLLWDALKLRSQNSRGLRCLFDATSDTVSVMMQQQHFSAE
jgi:hypothetical protein